MKKLILLGALLLSSACFTTEVSQELREPAVIEQTTFNPGGTATGLGYDMTGKGGISITETDIPDRYAVVLQCQHGKFTLRPDGENAKRIWSKFKQGDSVTIVYTEVYHVTDAGRELYKLDFLDAIPRGTTK